MGKIIAVAGLPDDIQAELKARLTKSRFSNYVEHAEWLCALGFNVSKSALHRYATAFKDEVLRASTGPDQLAMMSIRVQCLDIASRLAQPDHLYSKAEELLDWVRRV